MLILNKTDARGVSLIATVFILVILTIMGAAIVSIVSNVQESRVVQMSGVKAYYSALAGFEYGLKEIKSGGYPIGDRSFGSSRFNVFVLPDEHKMVSVGFYGDATSQHRMTVNPMGADCLNINTSGAYLEPVQTNILRGIYIDKGCYQLDAVNLVSLSVNWTPRIGERVQKVTIGNFEVFYDAFGVWPEGTIDINDYLINNEIGVIEMVVEFSQTMANRNIDITFTASDTSYVNKVVW